jgi:hypothetical protein
MTTLAHALALALALALGATTQDDLPPADTIIDQAVEAVGGEERLKKIKSQSVFVSLDAAGTPVTVEFHSAPPDRLLLVERAEAEQVGSNGNITWEKNTVGKYSLREGESATQMLKQSNVLTQLLNMKKDHPTRETVEQETVAGEPCYKVKLTDAEGVEQHVYFSIEHKRYHALDVPDEGGAGARYVVFGDWKKFGAITHYTKMSVVMKASGATAVEMNIDKVVFDKADPRLFDVPAEVMALAAARDREERDKRVKDPPAGGE